MRQPGVVRCLSLGVEICQPGVAARCLLGVVRCVSQVLRDVCCVL